MIFMKMLSARTIKREIYKYEFISKKGVTQMNRLSDLPNIGDVLEVQLKGIETIDDLKEFGSKKAWEKIKLIDDSACINRLYALEGAIQGVRWHSLSNEVKLELKGFYNNYKQTYISNK